MKLESDKAKQEAPGFTKVFSMCLSLLKEVSAEHVRKL